MLLSMFNLPQISPVWGKNFGARVAGRPSVFTPAQDCGWARMGRNDFIAENTNSAFDDLCRRQAWLNSVQLRLETVTRRGILCLMNLCRTRGKIFLQNDQQEYRSIASSCDEF
jgi:hypothetical protein